MISDDEIRYNQAFAKAQFDYDHAEPEYEDYPEHDKPVVNMFSDNKRNYYEFNARRRDGKYKKGDVDFIVFVALPIQTCWVVPFEKIKNITKININPKKADGRWTIYQEKWKLFNRCQKK